jgi:response regulator RpfG family c-di-GMP phosphodiesterase
VDDDPPVLRLLVETLRMGGFEVTPADGAEQAIDRFQANPHDVVLTDVRMKGVSGLQLLRTIRQISRATEVVIITGHATLDIAMEALHEGAYDLITKPLDDIDSLPRIVGRAAERRRLTEDNRMLVESLSAHNARLKDAVARLAAVNEVGRTTTGQLDAGKMYQSLAELVAQHLEARRVSILISEPASDTLTVVASVGITERDVLNTQVRLGDGIAGRVAASQAALLVQDIEKTELRRFSAGGRYNTPSFLITPLSVSCAIGREQKWAGVISASDKHSGDPFTEQDLEFLSMVSRQVSGAIESARRVEGLEAGYLSALTALIQASEERWSSKHGHASRVAGLAAALARMMNLPGPRVDLLLKAASLHGIGHLLLEPGREAPATGIEGCGAWSPAAVIAAERILAPITSLGQVREIILRAADSFLASPASAGASRASAPVESRILTICEKFDGLAPNGLEDPAAAQRALKAIQQETGSRQDAEILAALRRLVEGGQQC